MDRLIAFGAGAVLAFGLGYLVSYQLNGPDSEGELTRSPGDTVLSPSSGLVDAERPRIKALADLANQNDDSLTRDLSSSEIQDLKTMLLPHLTPADMDRWQEARDTYIAKYLREGEGPWAVGSDDARGKRFDQTLAHDAEGRYEGRISMPQIAGALELNLDVLVDIKGYAGSKPESRIAFHRPDGTPVWGHQFRWSLVGTDTPSRTLYVLVPPFTPEIAARTAQLALRIPADLDVGKATQGELLGLNQELVWVRVGGFELLKSE